MWFKGFPFFKGTSRPQGAITFENPLDSTATLKSNVFVEYDEDSDSVISQLTNNSDKYMESGRSWTISKGMSGRTNSDTFLQSRESLGNESQSYFVGSDSDSNGSSRSIRQVVVVVAVVVVVEKEVVVAGKY